MDDVEAAVQAAIRICVDTREGHCPRCNERAAAIRHVADVARRDALLGMPCQTEIGEPAKGPCASRVTVFVYNFAEQKPIEVPFLREMWCQRCDLLAEAEEAVRRDA